MGKRKRLAAEARKEAMKSVAIARLNGTPTSPRRMRVTADTIRGKNVEDALNILTYNKRHAARDLEKLLRSAIKNWESKNEGQRVEDSDLYVKTVYVDQGVTLKRFLPAPQGRAYRLRKRANHVTLIIDSRIPKPVVEETVEEEVKQEEVASETAPAAETSEVKETPKEKQSKLKAAVKKTDNKPQKKKADKKEKSEKKSPPKKGTKKK
ncbi:MAG TPA: 50S ribosomal protein L22 [Chitinophagales bacterium]|nr:50S ribosomal protein L22 [Chitinophagales bacterium]